MLSGRPAVFGGVGPTSGVVMLGGLVVIGSAAAGTLGAVRRREVRRRAAGCLPMGEMSRPGRRRRPALPGWLTPDRCLPWLVGLGAVAMVGGTAGAAVGVLAGLAARRLLPRLRSPAARWAATEQELLVRQLPLTADLLAACLGSCSAPALAAAAVAESVEPPMRDRLASAAAQLSLGAAPESCWAGMAADCPPLDPLARCLVRTSLSGAPPAAALAGLAQAQRATAIRAAHTRVRRAGVLATAPLGLCFLPAFVLIGVAPVVMGLTSLFAHRM